MKNITKRNILGALVFILLFTSACKKDEPIKPPVIIPEADIVNKFIYNALHDYYLWNSQIPALTNAQFQNTDSLNLFLNKYTDPQKLFTSLLYKYDEIDKWSFLVDNSKTIDDWISGTSKTMGYDFVPYRFVDANGNDTNVFAIVRYVYSGSPAEKAGLKRGDVILTVNDQQLSITNYQKLLLGTDYSKFGFADLVNHKISPNLRTMTISSVEMQENPINKDTIFTFENKKIGYLVYNGFNSDYDIQLNNVIKDFKDANIDLMILDLRYNGGGSVQTCVYLASMIYGTDNTKVFSRSMYNNILQASITQENGTSSLTDHFTSTIDKTSNTPATPINTLNLKKIYIIATDNTASASEMLINGLRPYLNVTVVGTKTYGKYVASATIRDWDQNGVVNPNHTYAMQPIIAKYANVEGVTDFVDGLSPNITAEEDVSSLLPFGDPNETLLKVVLDDIKGLSTSGMVKKSAEFGIRKIADSHDFKPFAHDMYINLNRKNQQ